MIPIKEAIWSIKNMNIHLIISLFDSTTSFLEAKYSILFENLSSSFCSTNSTKDRAFFLPTYPLIY